IVAPLPAAARTTAAAEVAPNKTAAPTRAAIRADGGAGSVQVALPMPRTIRRDPDAELEERDAEDRDRREPDQAARRLPVARRRGHDEVQGRREEQSRQAERRVADQLERDRPRVRGRELHADVRAAWASSSGPPALISSTVPLATTRPRTSTTTPSASAAASPRECAVS